MDHLGVERSTGSGSPARSGARSTRCTRSCSGWCRTRRWTTSRRPATPRHRRADRAARPRARAEIEAWSGWSRRSRRRSSRDSRSTSSRRWRSHKTAQPTYLSKAVELPRSRPRCRRRLGRATRPASRRRARRTVGAPCPNRLERPMIDSAVGPGGGDGARAREGAARSSRPRTWRRALPDAHAPAVRGPRRGRPQPHRAERRHDPRRGRDRLPRRPDALELFGAAGASVEGELVRFPSGICRQIVQATAPR